MRIGVLWWLFCSASPGCPWSWLPSAWRLPFCSIPKCFWRWSDIWWAFGDGFYTDLRCECALLSTFSRIFCKKLSSWGYPWSIGWVRWTLCTSVLPCQTIYLSNLYFSTGLSNSFWRSCNVYLGAIGSGWWKLGHCYLRDLLKLSLKLYW